MEKAWPRCDETFAVHPLIPAKHGIVHVKRRDSNTFFVESAMIIEELVNFKNSSQGVMVVKTRNIEFDQRFMADGDGRRGGGGRGGAESE